MGKTGQGQQIDFIATDIYRVADGRIAEDWHVEDNLIFLQQTGFIARQHRDQAAARRSRPAGGSFSAKPARR